MLRARRPMRAQLSLVDAASPDGIRKKIARKRADLATFFGKDVP